MFSLFFQTIQHRSALTTGLLFLPMTASLIVVTFFAGRLCARYGTRLPALVGLVSAACGYTSLAAVHATSSAAAFVLPFVAAGAGIALVVPSLTIACLGAVRPQQTGIASAVLNASAQIGGVLGVAVFAAMIGSGETATFIGGTHAALLTAAAALGISFVLLMLFTPPQQGAPLESRHVD